MHNELLEVFIIVSDCGSFSKAADKLYCSTVSIMKQMNNLEAKLEICLFTRTKRGITLTPAGESVYKDAKRMIAFSKKSKAKALRVGESGKKTIRIGTSLLRPCKPLIELLSLENAEHFPFHVEIVGFDDNNINNVALMLESNIDCFVSALSRTKWLQGMNFHYLGEYECKLLISKKHKLATKDILTWEDLEGESIFLVNKGESTIIDHLRDCITNEHPLIRVVEYSDFLSFGTLNVCLNSNYLIAAIQTWDKIHPSLIMKSVEWPYTIPYGIIYSLNPSDNVAGFINHIENILSEDYVLCSK